MTKVRDSVEPRQLYVGPNCDLEFLPFSVAERKVRLLGEVRRKLNVSSLFPHRRLEAYPKPLGLSPTFAARNLEQSDLDHLEKWSNVLGFECKSEALTILNQPKTEG